VILFVWDGGSLVVWSFVAKLQDVGMDLSVGDGMVHPGHRLASLQSLFGFLRLYPRQLFANKHTETGKKGKMKMDLVSTEDSAGERKAGYPLVVISRTKKKSIHGSMG
jgi:hypothetical protein